MFSFKQQVHGEIYEVDQNVLSVLDELKGHPKWYKRTLCEIIATEKVSGTTSFPGFSPKRPYGARERETLVGSGHVVPEQN